MDLFITSVSMPNELKGKVKSAQVQFPLNKLRILDHLWSSYDYDFSLVVKLLILGLALSKNS